MDADNDGWAAIGNPIFRLYLTRLTCWDTEDWFGGDELYFLIDGRRLPVGGMDGLGGSWSIGANEVRFPNQLVCERAQPFYPDGYNSPPMIRFQVLDDDDDYFPANPTRFGPIKQAADWDWLDDDVLHDSWIRIDPNDPELTATGRKEIPVAVTGSDSSYLFVFRVDRDFMDDPVDDVVERDSDGDGLSDEVEANLSSYFGGICIPGRKEMLVEVDSVTNSGEFLLPTTVHLITTQFHNHGIAPFFDINGRLGWYAGESEIIRGSEYSSRVRGGTGPKNVPQLVDYQHGLNGKSRHFNPWRLGVFHYVLAVDDAWADGEDTYGWGLKGVGALTDRKVFGFDILYDAQVITLMHELGHLLGLCHPREVRNGDVRCTHYSVPADIEENLLDAATAMGTPRGGELVYVVSGAIVRPVNYFDEEWWAAKPYPADRAISPEPESAAPNNHFYTVDEREVDNARENVGFTYENVACHVHPTEFSATGTVPLFRTFDGRGYFYTTSKAERDIAIASYGHKDKGVACYVFDTEIPGTTELYRLYDPAKGDHFYTSSIAERDYADGAGYDYEGVACWVYDASTPARNTSPLHRLLRDP